MSLKKQENMISLNNINFNYDEDIPILKDISLKIYPGKILGIVGPNGGGKSTLLKIIAGLFTDYKGTIELNGQTVNGPLHQFLNVAYVPQRDESPCILPLSVLDIIKLGNQKIDIHKLSSIVELFNLRDILESSYNKLSGGQQQRVLLAKALAQGPDLLILDEPTKGLDSLGQDQLLSLMKNIIEEAPSTSIVIVDHNLNQVIKNSDSILCLNRTHHWHDKKELINQDVINSVYHCEFEHKQIHEGHLHHELPPHHQCDEHGPEHAHHSKKDGED